jgi:hypothetical protein
MDHAEAHERIADLAIEPGRLAALRSSPSRDDTELLAHVASCRTCQAELDAWSGVQELVAGSLARGDGPASRAAAVHIEPIRVPDDLRARVLAIPRTDRTATDSARPSAAGAIRARRLPIPRIGLPGRPLQAMLGLAAVVVLVVGASILRDQANRLEAAQNEQRALSGVMAALDRLLTSPNHEVAVLRASNGAAAGSVSWSGHDIVVLTTALQPPPAGQVYRCWLREGDRRTPIGRMDFADGTAYWSGSLDDWATVSITSSSELGVSLEPREPAPGSSGGPAVLLADLGS